MAEGVTNVEVVVAPQENTLRGVASLALGSVQAEAEPFEQGNLDLKFFVQSPDHSLLIARAESDSIVGSVKYSTTRGAGFGQRGQFAEVIAKDDDTRRVLVSAALDEASGRNDNRIYFQTDSSELIEWHIANGAIDMSGEKVVPEWDQELEIFEGEMTFRYDVESSFQKIASENIRPLPDGYSIERFSEYDEASATQIAGLMPQLDSTFTPELTDERRANYSHMIDSDNYTIMLVKNEEGVVVGTLSLTMTDTETWQLEDVILDGSQRGNGLGKAMMQHMVQWAHDDGLDQILLQTEAFRTKAVGLYFVTGAEMLVDTKTLRYDVPAAA